MSNRKNSSRQEKIESGKTNIYSKVLLTRSISLESKSINANIIY